MTQDLEKMKKVYPLTWEHKIINGDLYFIQGVLPNGKVLVTKTMSELEFKSLFN